MQTLKKEDKENLINEGIRIEQRCKNYCEIPETNEEIRKRVTKQINDKVKDFSVLEPRVQESYIRLEVSSEQSCKKDAELMRRLDRSLQKIAQKFYRAFNIIPPSQLVEDQQNSAQRESRALGRLKNSYKAELLKSKWQSR